MSALTTRDALERVLQDVADARCPNHGRNYGGCVTCSPAVEEMVDALLASGAVLDAATLADDEALVDRAARAMLYRWPADEPVVEGDRDQARRALRGIGEALTERGAQ